MSVTVRLDDEVDVSRGDMLVHPDNRPRVARAASKPTLVWMHERPLDPQQELHPQAHDPDGARPD